MLGTGKHVMPGLGWLKLTARISSVNSERNWNKQ